MKKKSILSALILLLCLLSAKAQSLEEMNNRLDILKIVIPIAIVMIIIRFYRIFADRAEQQISETEVKPIIDENLQKIAELHEKSNSLSQEEYETGVNNVIDKMLSNISNLNEYYSAERTMSEIQKMNILSEEELLQRNNEIALIFNKVQIEDKISKKAKPLLDALVLSRANIIIHTDNSDFELEEKKTAILNKIRSELEFEFLNRPKLSDIDDSTKNKLSEAQIHKIEHFLSVIEKGEVIVLNDNRIKLIDGDRWGKIKEQDFSDKFQLIYER